jgi:hypothetical protein
MKAMTGLTFLLLAHLCAGAIHADTFGSGANTFDIEFARISNPGNVPDTTGDPNPAGSVPYRYRIGKYEISEDMIDKANALGALGITHDHRGTNKPATVNWFEAARFVNWLNTSTGGTPAYKFDGSGIFQHWTPADAGYNPNNLYRNRRARYFLPSVHEWYKAAYYDPISGTYYDYPTGSDSVPTAVASGTEAGTAVYRGEIWPGPADITLAGGLSHYGTVGQGGNAWEWEETDEDLVNDSMNSYCSLCTLQRGVRGGGWEDQAVFMTAYTRVHGRPDVENVEVWNVGFRVASIPEPSSLLLVGLAIVGLVGRGFNRRFIG